MIDAIEKILWFLLGFVISLLIDRLLWAKQWGKVMK